jgi:flavin-binding protein dodecin
VSLSLAILSGRFRLRVVSPTTPWLPVVLAWSLYMSVAKITEIQSSSSKSFEDAIQKGIARADKTLRNLSGAWIKSQKVVIEKGKITEYRVLLKVTFVLQD